jgi:transcriptional/translational regulatory protein YebC/TACO1
MACTKHYSARCHSYKLICPLLWASYSIKKGGPSPSSNTALAAILEKARELDIPREILERNIKRASEKDQDTYTEGL